MKKTFLSIVCLVVALGVAVVVQSCKKDDSGFQKYYATIQQYGDDKVYIDEPYSNWEVGDKIRIHGLEGTIGLDENDGRYYILLDATTLVNGNENSHSNITTAALYPSSLFSSTLSPSNPNSIELSPTQTYDEHNGHQKLEAPMAAYLAAASDYNFTENSPNDPPTLEFKNLCALLKVNIQTSSTITVTRIEVENTGTGDCTLPFGEQNLTVQSGRPLWGDFEILFDADHNPILREKTIWNASNDKAKHFITKKVILNLSHFNSNGITDNYSINGGKQISSNHSFYLYLPPVHYDHLHVAVYVKDGNDEKCIILESNKNGTFQANTIYPLTVEYDPNTWHTINPSNTIGEFTVGMDTVTVDDQEVYRPRKVTFSRANIQGHGEHDNNNTHYFLAQHQYHYIGYHNVYGLHDHFDQDDVATIMGLSQFNGWRLLQSGEFKYLLNIDPTDNDPGRTDANRFAWAVVASVPGIILFPDGYNNAQGLAHFPAGYVNNKDLSTSGMPIQSIEADEWYTYFESQGCVFLPNISVTGNALGISINLIGSYWKRNIGMAEPYVHSHQIKFVPRENIYTDLEGDERATEAYLRPVKDLPYEEE